MLNWTNRPEDAPAAPSFRLVRTPPLGRITAIVTAFEVIGTNTHFYNHRTMPCTGDGCDACAHGSGWRWHGYVSAFDQATAEHFLFEFPATVTEVFSTYVHHHNTLRGAMFQATRIPQRPNGRVNIKIKPADLAKALIPEPPDVQQLLSHIWGIKTDDTHRNGLLKGHSHLRVTPDNDPILASEAARNGNQRRQ